MAPKSGEVPLVDDKDSLKKDLTSETEEIWSSILKGVASSKIVPTKSVLILGDKDSGKSSLIRHLKGVEDDESFEVPKASDIMLKSVGDDFSSGDISSSDKRSKSELALSYTFVEVKDEDAEDTLARLGIYQIAGSHGSYQSLLRFALNSSNLPDSLVVIVLDWARPWTFVETLQRWIKFLEVGIENVKSEGSTGAKDGWTKGKAVVEELKESIEKFIQNYAEPDSTNQTTTTNSENDDIALPLGPGVLTTNLGVPLVVVCTKSDNVSNLERELDYKEEQFDYIQQSLRTICLKYGAALFYTTTRQQQTFTNLRKYILHRLLGFRSSSNDIKSAYAFNVKADYVERDRVLIPTGWDSWTKIKFLKEGFDCEELLQGWNLDVGDKSAASEEGTGEKISARKVYEEIIAHEDLDKPLSVQTPIEAEDEQEFFQRHFETLQRANTERLPPPSVVGPMGAPSYSYGDIGADIIDLDNNPPINTNHPNVTVQSRTKTTKVPSSQVQNPIPNGNPPAPSTNGVAASQPQNQSQNQNAQNEVLANFFQNLLSKRTATAPSSEPVAPVRKMVEKELDKLRNIPSTPSTPSTTASSK